MESRGCKERKIEGGMGGGFENICNPSPRDLAARGRVLLRVCGCLPVISQLWLLVLGLSCCEVLSGMIWDLE